jgi:catechol 2,3-dioxygenase-like lactoylglutathione lyase family enzyme
MEIIELNHVALHVQDVAKSVIFYKKLGFREIPRPAFHFPGAWFQLGKYQQLHLIGGRNEDVHSFPQGNHYALKCKSIELVHKELIDKEIFFRGPKLRPDGVKQIFIQDPDGYYIEFFEDNP